MLSLPLVLEMEEGEGGASECAEGFEAPVSYHEVESGHFWVGEAV